MAMNEAGIQKRIQSIDILRGLVMVIMALDHVRDYVHITANSDDPLNLATTTPALFFTRWITHFCAPVFVFLSGTSIYLQSLRKTKNALGSFLIKRGLWLIIAEWTIIAFAWTFNTHFNFIPFQVIWAIGISMVILGILMLTRLPYQWILITGLVIVAGHNLLDIPESAEGFKSGFWWDLIHHGHFATYEFFPKHYALIAYPFLPWTGLMMLGYATGLFFKPGYDAVKRRKFLMQTGTVLIILFFVLRYTNLYGNLKPWTEQKNVLYTILSFIDLRKYPPSLLYLCMTIGPSLIMLALLENVRNRLASVFICFGRTAFFYYILHIYLVHIIAVLIYFYRGHSYSDAMAVREQFPFLFVVPGEGFGLWGTYAVWLVVIIMLYPLCRWYDKYKTAHKEKWWLSYL